MFKDILYKGIKIRYKSVGHGKPLIFLHGYLESMDIWEEYTALLSDKFKVIAIDLLGHGGTECISDTHEMTDMADAIYYVLNSLGIKNPIMIGHSMGGYVTLAFEKKYPKINKAFVLFHSTAIPDTTQKMINRNREIDLVKQGKKQLICNTNIPLMYAESNRVEFADKIIFSKNICNNTSDRGVIAALKGMKNRKNNIELLETINKKVLFILGKNDELITFDSVIEQTKISSNIETLILNNSGHMGFFEEKDIAFNGLFNFINNNFD